MGDLMMIASNTEHEDRSPARLERMQSPGELLPGGASNSSAVIQHDFTERLSMVDHTSDRSAEDNVVASLRTKVRAYLNQKLKPTQREDKIVADLRAELPKLGSFYRTEQGLALFFRYANRHLYEISDKPETPFGQLATYWLDLSSKVASISRCLDRIRATVAQEAKSVQVHSLAYNSPSVDAIAINDFGGGMWYRERGATWKRKPNGSDGILFWTPGGVVESWTPDFSGDSGGESLLDWLIQQPHFAEDVLRVDDQRMLFRALLLAPFFPSLCKVRPVHAHLGLSEKRQHDTGKTMAGKLIGVLFAGARFEPTPKPESTEKDLEALRLELMHKPYVLLDNVDTDVKWLNDFLATYTTGNLPTKRRLLSRHYGKAALPPQRPKRRVRGRRSRVLPGPRTNDARLAKPMPP